MSTDLRRAFSPRLEIDEMEPSRYGATSHSTEGALFHGYRGGAAHAMASRLERRPCACGGWVTADPDAPGAGVALHNSIGRHVAWRAAHGFDLPIATAATS